MIDDLIKQAQQKESQSSSFFSKVFGSAQFNLEEAADLYIQVANSYRLQKDNLLAGQYFEKAANLQEQTDSKDEVPNTLIDAYKAYRIDDSENAARVLEKAVKLFTLRGQFRRSAQYEMDLGDLYQSVPNYEKAIEAFEKAGDWYFQDNAVALSNKAYLKLADLSALSQKYDVAITNYERVAKQSLDSALSEWSVKDYFFKAILTALAKGDAVASKMNLAKYTGWYERFATTKEYTVCEELTAALESNDEESFTETLHGYDKLNKLDDWKIKMGLEIKKRFEEADGDEIL